jgi:methionyl-tRNA synthetase
MIYKNLDGKISRFETSDVDDQLHATIAIACQVELPRAFASLDFSVGIEAWMRGVFVCNQYVDEQAPWALKKTDPERMRIVLLTLFVAIRNLAIAIRSVVPESSDRLLDQMGVPGEARNFSDLTNTDWYLNLVDLEKPVGVFPRLELSSDEQAS